MKFDKMTDLTVRRAVVDDTESIAVFNERMAWETERLTLEAQRLRQGVREVLSNPAKGFYLVAEAGGALAGQLLITFEWSDWRNGAFWWIQSVYVGEAFRRTGVFRALFAEVERLASLDPGVCGLRLYVEQDNERAQHTYRSLGMTTTRYRVMEIDRVFTRGD